MRLIRVTLAFGLCVVALRTGLLHAQTTRTIPRPPAQQPGAPQNGSAAPDGYAPIPEWAGQTHAPRVQVSVPYDVETVATGISGGYSIDFLPDGRILLVLTDRDGKLVRLVPRKGR